MRMEPMLNAYNDNSALQATCQAVGNPMLANMAATYGDTRSKEELTRVRVAEYGCSGGRNSYEPIHAMLSVLEEKSPGLRAECVLEDLPSNAWNQVMEETRLLTETYDDRVQVLCAGTSFFNQACADASLDLAFSYVSAHFLSSSQPLVSHVMMHEASSEESGAWKRQAAEDWEKFLLLRARELKKGGKIMLSTLSRDDSGYSWKRFSYVFWDCIEEACSQGVLTQGEAERLCIPACLRSEAELLEPFRSKSPAGSQFEVDSLQFSSTEVEGERDLPVHQLAPHIRKRVEVVWGGMFLVQLMRDGRDAESARGAMKVAWDLFEEKIAEDPYHGWLDMQCYYLELTKK